MNNKDLVNLIFPSIFFVVIAVGLFFAAHRVSRDAGEITSENQAFERVVDDVQSGKQQLSTDRALTVIGLERKAMDEYRLASARFALMLQIFGLVLLVGFGLHISALIRVRRRLKKLMPDAAPEPTAQ